MALKDARVDFVKGGGPDGRTGILMVTDGNSTVAQMAAAGFWLAPTGDDLTYAADRNRKAILSAINAAAARNMNGAVASANAGIHCILSGSDGTGPRTLRATTAGVITALAEK